MAGNISEVEKWNARRLSAIIPSENPSLWIRLRATVSPLSLLLEVNPFQVLSLKYEEEAVMYYKNKKIRSSISKFVRSKICRTTHSVFSTILFLNVKYSVRVAISIWLYLRFETSSLIKTVTVNNVIFKCTHTHNYWHIFFSQKIVETSQNKIIHRKQQFMTK